MCYDMISYNVTWDINSVERNLTDKMEHFSLSVPIKILHKTYDVVQLHYRIC